MLDKEILFTWAFLISVAFVIGTIVGFIWPFSDIITPLEFGITIAVCEAILSGIMLIPNLDLFVFSHKICISGTILMMVIFASIWKSQYTPVIMAILIFMGIGWIGFMLYMDKETRFTKIEEDGARGD